MIKKITTSIMILSVIATNFVGFRDMALAASVTTFSDTLSTLTAATDANHEILFITPTGVEANNDTIIFTFTGFDGTSLNAIDFGDVDLAESANASCSTPGSWTDKTLGAADGASTYGVATTTTQMLFDPPTTSGYITAGRCIRIKIGTNATGGVNQITNGSAASAHSIAISGNFADTGTASIDIIADDSVNVTAVVDPTITFTITDTTVGFGTLSNGTASWATGDLTGVTSVPADTSGAHEMTIGTNAASGYTITYSGATLTSGANTIDVATIAADNDGSPGTEQFGIGIDDNGGNVSIVADYDLAGTNSYKFVAGTTTAVASETIATATETIDVQYIANVATTTEAGAYSTDITWIATGNF
jgi:hypothetical protein